MSLGKNRAEAPKRNRGGKFTGTSAIWTYRESPRPLSPTGGDKFGQGRRGIRLAAWAHLETTMQMYPQVSPLDTSINIAADLPSPSNFPPIRGPTPIKIIYTRVSANGGLARIYRETTGHSSNYIGNPDGGINAVKLDAGFLTAWPWPVILIAGR